MNDNDKHALTGPKTSGTTTTEPHLSLHPLSNEEKKTTKEKQSARLLFRARLAPEIPFAIDFGRGGGWPVT